MAVKGRASIALTDGQSAELGPERAIFFRPADRRAAFTPAPGRSLRLVGYMVRADRVRRIFGDGVPEMLRPLLRGRIGASHVIPVTTSPAVRRLAATLFTSSLHGPLRMIFIEGVVLQLLAMKTAEAVIRASPGRLSRQERTKLEEARERLVADMRNPATAHELALAAGMSETALTAGFRALFGGTVYEVLRDERLEHARIAMETADVSLKEVAFRIGYRHVTNFISAFTRRYGAPPARYARQKQTDEPHSGRATPSRPASP